MTEDTVEYHKGEADRILSYIQVLKKQLHVHESRIRELSQQSSESKEQDRVKTLLEKNRVKQDYIVGIIRMVGHECTAGDICNQMAELGTKLHNSKFAAKYLSAVKADQRIIVRRVSNTKFAYSLREWHNG